jgi:hypothetical protein
MMCVWYVCVVCVWCVRVVCVVCVWCEDRAPAKQRAILCLLGNMLSYSLQGRRHVTLIDNSDFVKQCMWKDQHIQPLPDLRKGCVRGTLCTSNFT